MPPYKLGGYVAMRIATFTGAQREGRCPHAGWVNFSASGPLAPEKLELIQALPGVLDALMSAQDTILMVFLVPTASDEATETLSRELVRTVADILGENYTWERSEPTVQRTWEFPYPLLDSDTMPVPAGNQQRRWPALLYGPIYLALIPIRVWKLWKMRREALRRMLP